MSKDPAFLFYPGDYLRDTQMLSANTQVSYDRIMCEHMRNICITQKQLNFLTKRLTDDEKDELMMVLDKIPEGFQIGWVAESISKRKAYSESRRKNRESKPKKDMNNICESYDKHMENENENEIKDIIELPFESEEFKTVWDEWCEYRSKNKWGKYKAIKKHFKSLVDLSEGNEKIAIKIYEQSMANNYQGIFKLKTDGQNRTNDKPIKEPIKRNYTLRPED